MTQKDETILNLQSLIAELKVKKEGELEKVQKKSEEDAKKIFDCEKKMQQAIMKMES